MPEPLSSVLVKTVLSARDAGTDLPAALDSAWKLLYTELPSAQQISLEEFAINPNRTPNLSSLQTAIETKFKEEPDLEPLFEELLEKVAVKIPKEPFVAAATSTIATPQETSAKRTSALGSKQKAGLIILAFVALTAIGTGVYTTLSEEESKIPAIEQPVEMTERTSAATTHLEPARVVEALKVEKPVDKDQLRNQLNTAFDVYGIRSVETIDLHLDLATQYMAEGNFTMAMAHTKQASYVLQVNSEKVHNQYLAERIASIERSLLDRS